MPTMNVEAPMMMMVIRKVYLRPIMSPRRPNTSAPNGRTMKPAANASKAKMKAVLGSVPAKNCFGDNCGERAVEVKIVPFEHGAEGRGKNNLALFRRDHVRGLAGRNCRHD